MECDVDQVPRAPAQAGIATAGPLRVVLLVCGVLLSGLALLGVFLPILPTTPFLLVALGCFARSSPAFHRRLLAAPVFGPYLVQWREHRSVPVEAKHRACALVVASFGVSIWLVEPAGLRVMLVALGLALLVLLRRLPTDRS